MSVVEASGVFGTASEKALASPRRDGRRRHRLPDPRPAAVHPVRAASASGSSWPSSWPPRRRLRPRRADHRACTCPTSTGSSGSIDRFVDAGSTVIVIEHNLDVISRADHVLDLGPGAGADGGRVVFAGPPADLVAVKDSLTRRAPGPPARPPTLGDEIVGSTRDRGCAPTFSRRTHDLDRSASSRRPGGGTRAGRRLR